MIKTIIVNNFLHLLKKIQKILEKLKDYIRNIFANSPLVVKYKQQSETDSFIKNKSQIVEL